MLLYQGTRPVSGTGIERLTYVGTLRSMGLLGRAELNRGVVSHGIFREMGFHLRPYLLVQVGRHPLFLQCMCVKSDAEPIFATVLVRAQQLDTHESLPGG